MNRLLQYIRGFEHGQALPAVLICLLVGGVLISASLSFVDVNLRSQISMERSNQGRYAAEAGVEDVIWCLKNDVTPRTTLPQNINGMQSAMNTLTKGNYTLVAGNLVTGNSHSSDLLVTSDIVWDAGANAYKYTVTCTWTGPGQCKLIQVGAKLPPGYNYQTGSAALFSGNLSTGEPTNQLAGDGTHKLTWNLSQISLSPTRTQIFYITGTGDLEDDYGWAIAQRGDVGYVGELIGTFYVITAIATSIQDGQAVCTVVANVMKSGSSVTITSWRINPS